MHHNFVVLIQKVGVLLLALCSAALWSQNTKYSIDATLDIEHQSISVNQEMADADTVIHDGDEVAFLPPFSGGS